MLLKLSRLLPILCLIGSTLYSYFIIKLSGMHDSFPTIFYIILLALVFYIETYIITHTLQNRSPTFSRIAWYNISIYIGIIIGFQLAGAPEKSIWMTDSYTMHLPGSVNIANVLHGASQIRATSSVFDKIYFIHFWTGFWFWLIGVFPSVTVLAMLPLKTLTAFIIFKLGKKIFGQKEGAVASMIYIFMPTTLFYTVAFYKESMIHLAIASLSLSIFCIFITKELKYFLLLLPAALILSNERFYLFPIFLFTISLLTLCTREISYKFKIFICIIGSLTALIFYNKYQGQIPINRLVETLNNFRNNYNNYTDIQSAYNLRLSYPLAFIKLVFTPYFTFNKFNLFYDYSYLLIWGSLLNQVVIFLGFFQLIKSSKEYWYFLLPMLIFIIIFAYIAPYNGRLRDSFYPIIAIFSVRGFSSFLTFFQNIKKNKKLFAKAFLLITTLTFSRESAANKIFWSAETSLYGTMTLSPTDSSNLDGNLYVVMNNGTQKSLFVATSKQLQWDSYFYLPTQETNLPPKIAVLHDSIYFFHINNQTNHLQYTSYKNKALSSNNDMGVKSTLPFEVTANQNELLLAITPDKKHPTLYSFNGKSLALVENLPLSSIDSVSSICTQKKTTIVFFQRPDSNIVWYVEKKMNTWSLPAAYKELVSDISPTIKCIDDEIIAVTLHRSKLHSQHYEPKIHFIKANGVVETSTINVITLTKVSLSIMTNKNGSTYPRIIYNDTNYMPLHIDGQVQAHPGILESLFKRFNWKLL